MMVLTVDIIITKISEARCSQNEESKSRQASQTTQAVSEDSGTANSRKTSGSRERWRPSVTKLEGLEHTLGIVVL